MKSKTVIVTLLIILIIGSIVVPVRHGHQWLLFWNILLYASLGFLLTKPKERTLQPDQPNLEWPARLQMFVWSVIILATLSTALSYNFHVEIYGSPVLDPTNIIVPEALWILMGVSGLTMAGETLTHRNGNQEQLFSSTPTVKRSDESVVALIDLKNLEVEKLQFILFLAIAASGFLMEAKDLFTGEKVESLPNMSDTLAILSGVSSGAYVAARWR